MTIFKEMDEIVRDVVITECKTTAARLGKLVCIGLAIANVTLTYQYMQDAKLEKTIQLPLQEEPINIYSINYDATNASSPILTYRK